MGTHHQPYFLKRAEEELVHHSAAWVVKEPEHSPIFVDCHAVEDPALDRGWDLQVTVWNRDAAGIWACGGPIQVRESLDDAYDAAVFAEALAGVSGASAMIPYNVFEEVVDEHDSNYLIALAISIDQLPSCMTGDEVSRRIRLNADQDMDERMGLTVCEQDAPPVSLDELACVYGDGQVEIDGVEVPLER